MAKSRARKLADIIVGAGIDIDGNLTFDGGSTSADLTFADNDKANFGDASDLQIYHDGSNSWIKDTGTGSLLLTGSTGVFIRGANNENAIQALEDGAVNLYYDGSKKFETTSTGISVTGDVDIPDGNYLDLGGGGLTLRTNANNAYITESTSGKLAIQGQNIELSNTAGTETFAYFAADGAATLYYDNSAKLATDAQGVNVTGNADISGNMNLLDSGRAHFGNSNDLAIFHDGTDSFIKNDTGQLILRVASVESALVAVPNGAVSLYYDNSAKLATTSTGVDVTGTITADGLTFGTNHRIQGTGGLFIGGSTATVFEVGAGSEEMRLTSTGLGIGTQSPGNPLEIQHSTVGTGNGSNNTLALRYNSTTLYGQHYMDANGIYRILADNSGAAGGNLQLDADTTIRFATGSTPSERMRIDSSGNVGIGTTSPAAKLEVKASNSSSADWANKGIMSSVQINAANRTFGGLTMVDHGSGSGHAGLGFRYDGTGYKLELGTASSTSSGISTHLTIDRLGAIVTSGHLTVAADLMAGNVLSTHGHPNADDFIVGDITGTATGLTIVGASGSSGNIHFSDGTSSGNANIQGQLVYAHNDNSMRFYTAVAEKMRITSAGNVGIGTTSPSEKLTVAGPIGVSATGYTANATTANFGLYTSGSVDTTYIQMPASGQFQVWKPSTGAVVTVLESGNMGIGTATPGATLEVKGGNGNNFRLNNDGSAYTEMIFQSNGTSKANLQLVNNDFNITASQTGSRLRFYTENTQKMTLLANGNLGIGTTNPQTALHIYDTPAEILRMEGNDEYAYASFYGTVSSTAQRLGYMGFANDTSTAADFNFANNQGGIFSFNSDVHVKATDAEIRLQHTGNSYFQRIFTDSSNNLKFGTGPNGTERMRIDSSGNVGIGCTPSAHAFSKAIEIGDGAVWTVGGNQNSTFASNAYLASNASYKYIAANKASKINLYNGGFTVATTNTSGSANADITFTDRLTVLANGNVGIGTTPSYGLHVQHDDGVMIKGASGSTNGRLRFLPASGGRQYDFHNDGSSFQIYDASAGASRLYFHYNGNTGIGTTSPNAKLQVQVAASGTASNIVAAGTDAGIYLEDDETPTNPYFVSKIHNPGNYTAIGGIKFAVSPDAANYSWSGIKAFTSTSGAAGDLVFYTSGANTSADSSTERMRLDVSNNMLLGGTTTNGTFNIGSCTNTSASGGSGSGNNLTFEFMEPSSPNFGAKKLRLGVQGGGYVKMTMPGAAGLFIESPYQTADKIHVGYAGVQLDMNGGGFGGNQNMLIRCANDIMFHPGGSERWRMIAPTGSTPSVFVTNQTTVTNIGGTPPDLNSIEIGPGYINLNRDDTVSATQIQFGKNGSVAGSIVTTSSTTYNTTSDRRAKENIVDAQDAGELIDSIRVREFDWKSSGEHQRYGMVAQELLEVAPEVVHQPDDEEQMMGVDYSKLVPMLVKEIQSLRARVAELEGE